MEKYVQMVVDENNVNDGVEIVSSIFTDSVDDTIEGEESGSEGESEEEVVEENEEGVDGDDSGTQEGEESGDEEEGEESEEGSEEESEDDLFDDLDFEGAQEQNDEQISGLAKRLGFDGVDNEQSLTARINELRENAGRNGTIPEEVKPIVDKILQAHRNGENWSDALNFDIKISKINSDIQEYEDARKYVQKASDSQDVEEKKEFLIQYYKGKGIKGANLESVKERLDSLTDAEVVVEAQTKIDDYREKLDNAISSKRKALTGLEAEKANFANKTTTDRQSARKLLREAADGYKDPHSSKLTTQGKRLVTNAMNTEDVSIVLPRGIVENMFFTDGKPDPEKIVNSFVSTQLLPKKLDYVMKKGELESFKKLPNADAKKKTGKRRNGGESGSKKEESIFGPSAKFSNY